MQRQKSAAVGYAMFSISLILILVTGCGKTGPQGPAGATGATGAQGPVGPAGQNGNQIYSGSGAPATTTGATGDFYLDLAGEMLYGPRTSSGWGTGVSLKGSQGAQGASGSPGAQGAAGSQIYSGSGAPAGTIGAIGDFYLDKTNFLLYGPKTAGGWAIPINLKGPQGDGDNVHVDTFSLVSSDWLWNSTYELNTATSSIGYFTRYHDRAFSQVTQAVLDAGAVLVYFTPNLSNRNQWSPLPYSYLSFNNQFYYNVVFETMPGVVRLHYFYTNNGTNSTLPDNEDTELLATYKFKIVAISGTITTDMKRDHIHMDNYQEVSRYLGLSF